MVTEGTKGPHEDTSRLFMHQNFPIDLLLVELHVFRYVLPPSTLFDLVFRGTDHIASQSLLALSRQRKLLPYVEAPLCHPARVPSFADACEGILVLVTC